MVMHFGKLGIARSIPTTLRSRLLPKRFPNHSLVIRELLRGYMDPPEVSKVSSTILIRCSQAFRASKAVLLLSPEEESPSLVYEHGHVKPLAYPGIWSHPLVRRLASQEGPLGKASVEALPQWRELPPSLIHLLQGLDAQVYAPLRAQSQLMGILVLGPKAGGLYTNSELKTIEIACCISATLMENARLSLKLQGSIQALAATEENLLKTARLTALGHLVAEVAHEVGNSLQTMHHLTYLLPFQELPESAKRSVKLMGDQVDQAKSIMGELLSFARSPGDRSQEQDLGALLTSALTLGELHTNAPKVEMALRLEKDLPTVKASGPQLKQVFYNVICNALDEMPQGGSLSVSAAVREGHPTIVFSDTGPGMSELVQQRIFEPFFTTKSPGEGTGLGLSVSKRTVQSHGGYIRVSSKQGSGASIIIGLPVHAENQDSAPSSQRATTTS